MTISFNQIPGNIRVPGAYIEIDSTKAFASQQLNARILVFGQKLVAGTQPVLIPKLITSYSDAVTAFGQGSHLANMFEVIFKNNPFTEKWAVAMADPLAGVAAAGTVTLTGTSTASGTLALYFGGVLVPVAVNSGDSLDTIATAVVAAITANSDLPIEATNTAGVIDVVFKHKGLIGNQYSITLNLANETTPTGLTVTIAPMAGGTLDPDISAALAALPEEIFGYWVNPYTSDATMILIEDELASRWSPLRMLEGHSFSALGGTTSTVSTYGSTRNSEHVCVMDAGLDSPSPAYLWAAATCAQVAYYATNDPARPFKTIPLTGIFAPPVQSRRTNSEQQTLLFTGIATHELNNAGAVQIQRLITNYQFNGAGIADTSYLDANTLFTLSYMRQSLRTRMTSRFPRHKLADDNTPFGAGQAVATPSIIKGEIIAVAGEWVEKGLMEDMESFKTLTIVERDVSDRTRVNAQIPPNLINQLNIQAIQISFIL